MRRFYVEGLGIRWVEFDGGRHALQFGTQKINLHYRGRELEPRAAHPTPGSADLCFLTDEPLEITAERMARLDFPVVEAGPTHEIRAINARGIVSEEKVARQAGRIYLGLIN